MLIGALPRDQVDAAPAAQVVGTDTPTRTPTFSVVWKAQDETTTNQVWVDPFSQQFQFFPAGDTPVAAIDTAMKYSRQNTTWKWSDTNRACNATPVPGSTRVPR